MPSDEAGWDVHRLRRRWKPTKERLLNSPSHQPLLVRFHRACSWLQRIEAMDDDCLDERLVFQWVALNALYGQWDDHRREPIPDSRTVESFFQTICRIDAEERLPALLAAERPLVMAIFEDPYLCTYFWESPSAGRARQTLSTRRKANTWYIDHKWQMILDRVIERIYLLRCQLVHGAATCRGKLNRTALQRCSEMLGKLLPNILLVIIDHGVDVDWGTLCYPPDPAQSAPGGQLFGADLNHSQATR